ncbi:MFS transporter [Pelomonas sp. KK5]|uniref:MFS transporter n=1 Tax=Pelomonas sp. KK5 TaxID=1855730 RepID=UPI00097BFA1C|nr:MFS transporter [Pelomonas sp. KK5]
MTPTYRRTEALAVLVAMILVTITLSLATTPFGQIADPVRRTFGISDVKFSLLIGALFAVPSMVMSVGGGWLADRLSRRRLLIGALLVWTGGAIGTALASSYEQLAVARLLVASAAGVKFPLAMTWIADAFPAERRGKAVGALFVVIGVGPAIGAAISGIVVHAAQAGVFKDWPLLAGLEPWRQAVALLAASNLLLLPLIAVLRETRQRHSDTPEVASSDGRPALPLLLVGAMVLGSALFSLADTANLAWLPTVLSRQHGFDAQQVGFAFGAIATIAGSLGPIAAGYIDAWAYKRFGSPGRLRSCAIAALLCAPCLMAFGGSSAHVLIGALIVSGVISMMAMTLSFLAIQAALPPSKRGFGSGLANAVSNLASASAPTLVAMTSAVLPVGPGAIGVGVAVVAVGAFALNGVIYAMTATGLGRWERALH